MSLHVSSTISSNSLRPTRIEDKTVISLCGRRGCVVCDVYRALISQGAKPANREGKTALRERRCKRNILIKHESQCEGRLRLDEKEAKYRRIAQYNRLSPMCDYAILGIRDTTVYIRVLELKGGAAETVAIKQINAGLRLIDRFLPSGIRCDARAYVLANRSLGRLKRVSVGSKIMFRNRRVPFEIEKCGGDTLYV